MSLKALWTGKSIHTLKALDPCEGRAEWHQGTQLIITGVDLGLWVLARSAECGNAVSPD